MDLLKGWMKAQGHLALEDLCYLSRIKFYSMRRIIDGMKFPSELEQVAISNAVGIPRDELFPPMKRS